MAKVMVSFPDDLLVAIDAEAKRQRTTRSGLLQKLARKEIGLPENREEILATLDRLASQVTGSFDVVAEIRRDRQRDG